MRTMVAILMAITLVLAAGSQAVFAQAGKAEPSMMPPRSSERPMKSDTPLVTVPRASNIIGLTVTNDQHQDLGKIADLILSSDGRVSYVVISRGGILGVGDKLSAIPWQASNPRIHEKALVVDISKERFEKAPSFASWAEFKTTGFESKVRAYYGE